RHACYFAFVPTNSGSGTLFLVDDVGHAGGPYATATIPGNNYAANTQCSLYTYTSSVSASGNTLTLNLQIAFGLFPGNKVIYMATRNNTLNSGWQAVGTVTIP